MAKVLTLQKEGYSEHKIGVKLHFTKTAVHNAIKNFQTYGTLSNMRRRGRPRKTTIRDDYTMMKNIATCSPSSLC